MKKIDLLVPLTTLFTAVFMAGFISAGYLIIQSNAHLPDAHNIKNIELKVPLRVYSADGLLISEFGNERRKPLKFEQVPQTLIDAILASEDDNFYNHRGIDVSGLIRAALSNFQSGASQQGASTITMQVARNFFLSREKTYIRKLNEVLLSIKLEQILAKDEILSLYLNKIFLGHRAYGFGAAADVYYGRDLNELSLAETAMLAGLPKAPSSINPLRNPTRAVKRRNYVLGRLLNLNKIDQAQYDQAIQQTVTASKHSKNSALEAPYIAEMVRAKLIEEFGEDVYWQGLNVYTTIESRQQKHAQRALRAGLQNYDKRHGFRGPIAKIDKSKLDLKLVTQDQGQEEFNQTDYYADLLANFIDSQEQVAALVTDVNESQAVVQTRAHGQIDLAFKNARWAKRYRNNNIIGDAPKKMTSILETGDVIYIQPLEYSKESAEPIAWQLSQIPNLSGALVSMQPDTGKIISLIGGYDFFLNKYNRATQAIRQPGSNIKPLIYSASLDKGFTPASLISGAPIVITDPTHGTRWRPENYSGKFFGPTRMREALTKSLNLVSIRILRAIGIPYAKEYLERFGLDMGRFSSNLTMALGAGGVTPLEMLTAYSALANTGYRVQPYFINHITDRDGTIVYQAKQTIFCDECYQQYLPKPVIVDKIKVETIADIDTGSDNSQLTDTDVNNANTADETAPDNTYQAPRIMSLANNYLTVSMLKDVVRRGTARKALALKREDLAGKTGTTNDYVDAWFTGFNSQVATTVWVGFDEPKSMGRGEAGGKAALPIWVDYMREALSGIEQDSQQVPDYIEKGWINKRTGKVTDEFDPEAIVEYFPIEAMLPDYMTPPEGNQAEVSDDFLDTNIEELDLSEIPKRVITPRIIDTKEDTDGLF